MKIKGVFIKNIAYDNKLAVFSLSKEEQLFTKQIKIFYCTFNYNIVSI